MFYIQESALRLSTILKTSNKLVFEMVFEMVFVLNICTVKTYDKTSAKYKSTTNMEWTETTSESGLIRPKQTKNKKIFFLDIS